MVAAIAMRGWTVEGATADLHSALQMNSAKQAPHAPAGELNNQSRF